jgi:hypothetical protein
VDIGPSLIASEYGAPLIRLGLHGEDIDRQVEPHTR